MKSPFPGMDPYLEQPAFWSSFHSKFIIAIADAIEANLDPAYYVEVETRSYLDGDDPGVLVGIPDVTVILSASAGRVAESEGAIAIAEPIASGVQRVTVPMVQSVKERYLEIRDIKSGSVITAIELLSPKNKRAGDGRSSYENKRALILGSLTHLVELDLLRAGTKMPLENVRSRSDYQILISRSFQRPQADLYGIMLRDLLPTIAIPLAMDEAELSIDLQAVFDGVYRRSRYQSRIDYSQPLPPPKLEPIDQDWISQLLHDSQSRS